MLRISISLRQTNIEAGISFRVGNRSFDSDWAVGPVRQACSSLRFTIPEWGDGNAVWVLCLSVCNVQPGSPTHLYCLLWSQSACALCSWGSWLQWAAAFHLPSPLPPLRLTHPTVHTAAPLKHSLYFIPETRIHSLNQTLTFDLIHWPHSQIHWCFDWIQSGEHKLMSLMHWFRA